MLEQTLRVSINVSKPEPLALNCKRSGTKICDSITNQVPSVANVPLWKSFISNLSWLLKYIKKYLD